MIDHNLKVEKSIEIFASAAAVWDALINPDKIKVYLFGTEAHSDWELGSPIRFDGEFEGKKYSDKGNVLESKIHEILQYDYWSGFSGLEDKPENYSRVTYQIVEHEENRVGFTWKQEGFSSKKGCEHTEKGLSQMLIQIKNLVESAEN